MHLGNQLIPRPEGRTTLEVPKDRVSKKLTRALAQVRGEAILRDARVQAEAAVSVSIHDQGIDLNLAERVCTPFNTREEWLPAAVGGLHIGPRGGARRWTR
jgi:hypothetical protein